MPSARGERCRAMEIRDISVAMTTPAVRMLAIYAYAWKEDDWHTAVELHPVVAIQASVQREYGKDYRSDEERPCAVGTEEELLKRGWRLEGQYTTTSALLLHPDSGLVRHDDWLTRPNNCTVRLVGCPWPQEEDETRLAGIVAEMKAEILESTQNHEQRKKNQLN